MDSKRYIKLLKKFEKIPEHQEPTIKGSQVRFAILSNSETNQLQKCLSSRLFENNYQPKLFKTEYNNIATDSLDESGDLHQVEIDFVFFIISFNGLKEIAPSDPGGMSQFAESFAEELNIFISNFLKKGTKVFLSNIPEPIERSFGNYSRVFPGSFLHQIQALNIKILKMIQSNQGLYLVDLQSRANYHGNNEWSDNGLWLQGKYPCHPKFFPIICDEVVSIYDTLMGRVQKCLILDLDNTLWGGVAGDDGIDGVKIGNGIEGEAYVQFQKYILELKNRGIVLAIASKNFEEVALDIIENHPRMVLRKEDFAVIKANWENKASNIQEIADELNIGLDSLVFLDDNPFERGLVSDHLPQVCVPELPEDPTQFVDFLSQLSLFETTQFSSEDITRSQFYYSESERKVLKKRTVNLESYLSQLDMKASIRPIDGKSLPRAVQLSQRSNQFNLRTQRIDEMKCRQYIDSKEKVAFTVELTDKYGPLGIISCVFMSIENKKLFIDEFIMSCRVLKRTVENLIFNEIVRIAASYDLNMIRAEYIPTTKNKLVENLYSNYGFEEIQKKNQSSLWELKTQEYKDFPTSIKVLRS